MISFSDFGEGKARSAAYRVWLNGTEVPVYTCRISAYPFNTWWPGHQRPLAQSEVVSFVNLVSDEPVSLEVEPLAGKYEKIMLKPYSKGVKVAKRGEKIAFSLAENGGQRHVMPPDEAGSLTKQKVEKNVLQQIVGGSSCQIRRTRCFHRRSGN